MQQLNDEQFDRLLGDHFARELAGEEGRALRHFEKMTGRPSHRWSRFAGWGAGLAAGAAAACIGLLWTHPPAANNVRPSAPEIAKTSPGFDPTPVKWATREESLRWNTLDEGTHAWTNGQAVRQLRRVEVERVRYLDAEGRTLMETVVPRERVMVIDARTY